MESSANGSAAAASAATAAAIHNDNLKQCAAGELCIMSTNINNNTQSSSNNDASLNDQQTTCCCCMNCNENMHETCGCSFSDIESVHGFNIPLHLLSVDGQEKLDRHTSSSVATSKNNKNDLLMCSMCIEMIKGEVIAAMNDVMKKSHEDDRKRGGGGVGSSRLGAVNRYSSEDIAQAEGDETTSNTNNNDTTDNNNNASNSRLASVEMIDDDGNDAPIPISQQQPNYIIDSDMQLKRAIALDMGRVSELQPPESQSQLIDRLSNIRSQSSMNSTENEDDDAVIKKRARNIPSQPMLNHNNNAQSSSSSTTSSFNQRQSSSASGRWRSRSRYQMNSTTTTRGGTSSRLGSSMSSSSGQNPPLRTTIQEESDMDVQSQYTSGNQSQTTHSTGGGTRSTATEVDEESPPELLEPQIPLEAVVVEDEPDVPVYDAVVIQPEDDESRHHHRPPPKREVPWYKRTSKRLISLVLLVSIGFAAMIGVILGTQLDSSNNDASEKNNDPSEGDNVNLSDSSLFGADGVFIINPPSSLRPSTSPSLFPSSTPIIPTQPPTLQPVTPQPTELLYYADYVNKRCSNDPANRPSANLGQKLYERVEDCCNAAFYYLQNYDCVLASLGVTRAPTPSPTTKVPTVSPSELPTLSPLTPTYYPSISNIPTPTPTVHWEPKGESLLGESTNDWAGRSVSLSGDASILAIGASRHDTIGNNAGHVQVYKWVRWTITGTPGWNILGEFINGDQAGDWFGHSVSLSNDGTRLAVGAQYADGNVST